MNRSGTIAEILEKIFVHVDNKQRFYYLQNYKTTCSTNSLADIHVSYIFYANNTIDHQFYEFEQGLLDCWYEHVVVALNCLRPEVERNG